MNETSVSNGINNEEKSDLVVKNEVNGKAESNGVIDEDKLPDNNIDNGANKTKKKKKAKNKMKNVEESGPLTIKEDEPQLNQLGGEPELKPGEEEQDNINVQYQPYDFEDGDKKEKDEPLSFDKRKEEEKIYNRELVNQMKEFYLGERSFDKYTLKKEYLENRDNNAKLYHQVLKCSSHCFGSFLIVHGACEHSTRYLEVARHLADNKFEVHLFDKRGFGYSSGPRVMTSVKDIFEDIMLVMTKIRKNNPLFVLAHSMGGAAMISFLKLNPHIKIAGLVLTNPFVNFPQRMKFNFIDKLIIKLLPDTLNSIMINNEIDPHILTRSEQTLGDIWKDRLLNPMVTIKYCKTMIDFSDIVRNFNAKTKFNYPVFLITSMNDRLTEMDASCQFFDKLICDDKSFYYFEEGLHEILLDEEKEDSLNLIIDWAFNRLNNAEPFGKLKRLSL